MVPVLNPITRAQQLYNESHIHTRNSVERQIGCWKRRFPILAYGLRYKAEPSCNIIVATAVLHNLAIQNNEAIPPAPEHLNEDRLNYLIAQENIDDVPAHEGNEERQGRLVFNYRQNLINNYFGHLKFFFDLFILKTKMKTL